MIIDEEYTHMCDYIKLQRVWRLRIGDFVFWKKTNALDAFNDIDIRIWKTSKKVKKEKGIWIPRLDQLAMMIAGWDKENSQSFFSLVLEQGFMRGKDSIIHERWFANSNSLEKHLLKIIARQQWGKRWNYEKTKWENL